MSIRDSLHFQEPDRDDDTLIVTFGEPVDPPERPLTSVRSQGLDLWRITQPRQADPRPPLSVPEGLRRKPIEWVAV
jgi:hypothetical protein